VDLFFPPYFCPFAPATLTVSCLVPTNPPSSSPTHTVSPTPPPRAPGFSFKRSDSRRPSPHSRPDWERPFQLFCWWLLYPNYLLRGFGLVSMATACPLPPGLTCVVILFAEPRCFFLFFSNRAPPPGPPKKRLGLPFWLWLRHARPPPGPLCFFFFMALRLSNYTRFPFGLFFGSRALTTQSAFYGLHTAPSRGRAFPP